jgi:FkbM family methyltransferase
MKILYGILDNSIDVTDICIEKLKQNNIITIPCGDENRARFFTDPLFGILKQVIIENEGIITEYDIFTQIKINTLNNQVTVTNENNINNKIAQIHSNLKIEYGSILYELPEQKMVVRYLTGKEKVLEIGANIGRNSLVIASILGNDNQRNFVSLESDINIANQLTHNRELNNFNFHIESSALSNRKLIQKCWDTKPSETLEEGFTWVRTITLAELKNKYNIEFDTLVLDCEGAFYYILMDMPELLNNINLIIMENDYWEIDKKNYIDDILKQNNFYVDYVESGGWGPCYSNFFEVWKKMC